MSQIDVQRGPVAVRIGRYWIGVASGNIYSQKKRRDPDRAISDAMRLERPGGKATNG